MDTGGFFKHFYKYIIKNNHYMLTIKRVKEKQIFRKATAFDRFYL